MDCCKEYTQTTHHVAVHVSECCVAAPRAIVAMLEVIVTVLACIVLTPLYLLVCVAFSPIVLAVMAARRLNKCFTPPSELDEVLV